MGSIPLRTPQPLYSLNESCDDQIKDFKWTNLGGSFKYKIVSKCVWGPNKAHVSNYSAFIYIHIFMKQAYVDTTSILFLA